MCILNDPKMLEKERAKTGQLQLWKVVEANNSIGLWGDTDKAGSFSTGMNLAVNWNGWYGYGSGQFHCFFSRRAAREYRKHHGGRVSWRSTKIIKVYAARKDIMDAGLDNNVKIPCISVSKMEIKSLKHQR